MLDLGLRAAEARAFNRALRHSHEARTVVTVLDRNEHELTELPHRIVSGAVHIDAKSAVDRSLELEIVETDRKFHFIPGNPSEFALYADNFLKVAREIWVAELDQWVHVPVFTGPISSVSDDGSTISVQAVGKESLGLAPALAWQSVTYPKGMKITDAIHDLMYDQGERHFDMPSLPARTRSHISVARQSEPWKIAQRLASSVDRQLFYDGRGRLRLRVPPASERWTFSTGNRPDNPVATVLSRPSKAFDLENIRNTVLVLGPKPENKRPRLRWVAQPAVSHPLSAQSLARNGQPRYLVEVIEMDHANRLEQVRKRAERELDDFLKADLEVTFDALPAPHLEPGDRVALDEDGAHMEFRLQTFSIPLIADVQSIGTNRRVSKRKNSRHG